MPSPVPATDPCVLCGGTDAERSAGYLRCSVCHWRVGDTIDPDVERPRVDVVYYLRYADRIKIGTSARPRQRLGAIWHDELLAFELGGRALEQQRHRHFAAWREGGEWFRAAPELLTHIAALDCPDPWRSYARWVSAALRRIT
ncbi:GIY-YIG nuclease family protein [Microbacterium sp. BR1]|uniref:GIY-YIG nuclease family protein n=1 Tax=Microbacterium sp. BR1 TaxID=1070896 RepID=UPI000C2B9066|nr:GIY-YIG nuclease family protein [Microbacterium sp. BR1]